jgi:hypothetical protein
MFTFRKLTYKNNRNGDMIGHVVTTELKTAAELMKFQSEFEYHTEYTSAVAQACEEAGLPNGSAFFRYSVEGDSVLAECYLYNDYVNVAKATDFILAYAEENL